MVLSKREWWESYISCTSSFSLIQVNSGSPFILERFEQIWGNLSCWKVNKPLFNKQQGKRKERKSRASWATLKRARWYFCSAKLNDFLRHNWTTFMKQANFIKYTYLVSVKNKLVTEGRSAENKDGPQNQFLNHESPILANILYPCHIWIFEILESEIKIWNWILLTNWLIWPNGCCTAL